MQAMTALLVLGWETRSADAPVAGKLFEYVGAGRPVLVCAPAHYEARRLIECGGLGVGAWTGEELVRALETLESLVVCAPARLALSRQAMAAELAAVFARIPGKPAA
jgi:hypothetical protein